MLSAEAKLYLYLGAAWVENHDVLQSPPLTWEYGIEGAGPKDLLASTGFLNAYLDNSRSNSAAKDGLYSPDHANLLANFAKGIKAKVTLPNHVDWEQEFDEEIADFDAITPGWDGQAFMEGNDMSEFDGEFDVDGDLNPSAASARYGSYGMELAFDDANIAHAWLNLVAIDQTSICIKFDFDPHDVTLAVGKTIDVCTIQRGTGPCGILRLRNIAGQLHFTFYSRHDGADYDAICTPSILSDWNEIVLYIKAATGDGANDGIARMYLNSDLAGSSTTLDNDTIDFDFVCFGMNSTSELGFGGSYYFDNIMIDTVGSPYESIDGAHNGLNGLAFPVMDTTARYVQFTDPAAETVVVSEFWVDTNALTMVDMDTFVIHLAEGANVAATTWTYYISLNYSDADGYSIRGVYLKDSGYGEGIGWKDITDEPHHVRVEWGVATAPAADDGYIHVYIDGELSMTATNCDNDQRDVDTIDFGYVWGDDPGTYDIFYLDKCRWSNQLEQVKFIGNISAIRPAAGLFDHPAVEIEALDWIGYLSDQELGILPVQETKRADQALTTALTSFPIQPIATDFDTGVQTFLLVFDTESPKSTMASFFQKMCRNELGRVYSKGNGTLRFEKQGARALITYPDFELDGIMTEFITSYERADVFNIIQAKITPVEASLEPDVLLWDLKVAEYFGGVIPSIAAGETLVLNCPFTDPALNKGISAIDVVDPIENIEFGSVGDFESNDMIGDLVWSQTLGGHVSIVSLENTHGVDTGYLNDLQIYGRALYTYGKQTLESRDQASIDSGIGERRFVLRLEEIADVETAMAFTVIVKDRYCDPHIRARRINFLANQEFEVLHGAIAIEPSTRFTATESVTGVSKDFYVNRIKYTVRGPWLWVDVLADPVRI